MDGRCQEAVGAWARQNFGVEYPDTLTIAGADGVLLSDAAEWERALVMAKISTEKHGATQAVVIGHSGCAGFVASPEEHQEAIRNTVAKITGTGLYETVVGLYHDVDAGTLEEVCRARGARPAVPAAAVA
jgi:hypothetical protein